MFVRRYCWLCFHMYMYTYSCIMAIQKHCQHWIRHWHIYTSTQIEKYRGKPIITTENNTDNTLYNSTEITSKQKWEEKQVYECFKRLTHDISHKKTWTWLRKGNLERETESLLIAAKKIPIRTKHIKASINKMPGGTCGVMGTVIGNGHSDTSSNPGWDWLHFT